MINGADIVEPDGIASNGVIHVINQMLMPPGTITGIAISRPDRFTLEFLIKLASLQDVNSLRRITISRMLLSLSIYMREAS
jgi:hypothetical protein